MSYEICVSKNGRHLFATHKRSITCLHELKPAYKEISAAFPTDKGYEISVSRWQTTGTTVLPSEME